MAMTLSTFRKLDRCCGDVSDRCCGDVQTECLYLSCGRRRQHFMMVFTLTQSSGNGAFCLQFPTTSAVNKIEWQPGMGAMAAGASVSNFAISDAKYASNLTDKLATRWLPIIAGGPLI